MNRIAGLRLVAAVPTLLWASAALIAQADDGAYVGVEGGANWESPQDLREDHSVIDRINFDTGWAAGLIGGYSFANGLRPELEFDHRSNHLDHDLLGLDHGLDRAESGFANLWYDFKAPSGFFSILHPYLGGGVGAVRSYYHNADLGFPIAADYATEFGYQAGAGIGFDVTSHLTLGLDYRHVWTDRGAFTPALAGAPPLEQRYLANTMLISARYAFGSPAPEAPAMASPPPPPAPPPPPVAAVPAPAPRAVDVTPPCTAPAGFQVDANCRIIQQTVIVRAVDFEFNSVRLTDPARETLDQVASALARQPELRVEIQGYTDSIGKDAYNLQLSQRRADAVKSYLISKGANGTTLSARGYGKADPVATNDTPENRAKNRRVAFVVTYAPPNVKVQIETATPESTEAAMQPGEHPTTDHP
jgi:outer membrane protein OmpA-like peptidoglycan-associated protein